MMTITALIVLPYIVFVFFSESFNPLVKPRVHGVSSRWRLGRRMGLAVLTGGLAVVGLLSLTGLTLHFALAAGLVIAAVLAAYFSMARIRKFLLG